jgi:acyl-CoA thioester hydrolase
MTGPTDNSDQPDQPASPAAGGACRIEFRVRYAEVDQMGAVHHSRYWVYFEMGRTELLRRQGVAYADLEREGVFFVVAKCSAKFLAPARYDDLLALTTRIVRMGAARIDHEYELHRQASGQLLCTAQTTLACVDRCGQIAAIPDSIRRREEG